MNFSIDSALVALAAGSSALLCVGGFTRSPRSPSHRFFALGMALLVAESLLGGLALFWGDPGDQLFWFKMRNAVTSLIPGTWLMFILAFGERDFIDRLRRWKWVVLITLSLPPVFALVFPGGLFRGTPWITETGDTVVKLGWSSYTFNVVFILGAVLVMVVMENTLRSSRGIKRWQVKFLAMGILGYFAVRVYTSSQAILFHLLDLNMEITFPVAALFLANLLILVTFIRTKVFPEDIYLSREFIHRSLVLILVGGYLIATALLAKALSILGGPIPYRLLSFLVFAALILLAAFLFSDRMRFMIKKQVSLHFKRPSYNYREIWRKFTDRTSKAEDIRDLTNRAAAFVSEMLEILSVNIWLFSYSRKDLELSGSTTLSSLPEDIEFTEEEVSSLREFLNRKTSPFRISQEGNPEKAVFPGNSPKFLEAIGLNYGVPLRVGEDLLGLVALDLRVSGEELGIEELELLDTVGDQMAASIQNLKLSEQLQHAREMEALRKFSGFFVHDLKNVASKLSMMLQNFPEHYNNPNFREDALVLVEQSVEKMNLLTRRMSQLREAPQIRPSPGILSEVVRKSILEFELPPDVTIIQEHGEIPEILFDTSQVSKVVTNLVLNAIESVGNAGEIHVKTFLHKGWVVLEVQDDGVGMDENFISNFLFQPFKTTKENGLGIGLYQCRTLIESHGGTISVHSQPGKGATFHVQLPMRPPETNRTLGQNKQNLPEGLS